MSWYDDLKAYAQQTILDGGEIPGWKVVAGRSVRAFHDTDAAFQTLIKAGYDDAMLYDRKPVSLSELEKRLGKKSLPNCWPTRSTAQWASRHWLTNLISVSRTTAPPLILEE